MCSPSVPTSHGHALRSKGCAVTPQWVVQRCSLCSGLLARHPHTPPTSRGVGSRGLCRRAGPGRGAAVGRPRPPRAGRGGRAGARGEGGQRRGEWPGRDGLINSPRRDGGGRSRRSRRCRCAPAAVGGESGPRTAPPPRRPAPTMTAETHLQGVEISAAQFFEIWHHYDSDGDSFPSGAAGARGARGASPREAGGTAALPARERPGPRPPPQPRSRPERGRCRERRGGAARREGAAGSETPLPALENGASDGSRNSFCCSFRQWVHGREGATKLHPGAAAGTEEGRLGRLMFRPTFPSSSGKKSFLEQTPVPRFLVFSLAVLRFTHLPHRAKGNSLVRNERVANPINHLLWKGETRVRLTDERLPLVPCEATS